MAGEGEQVAAAGRDGAGERHVQIAGSSRSKIGVEQQGLRRSGHINLAVGEEFAAHAFAAGEVQQLQTAQPHTHSQHYLGEVAQTDAAEYCGAAAGVVRNRDVVEVQAVVVDMEGAVDAVGDACGRDAYAGVVDCDAAAGEGEAVERTRSRQATAHTAGDFAKEAADERFGDNQVDAVEVGSEFYRSGLGMIGSGAAEHFTAVQVVAHHHVQLVVGVVPVGARPERSGIHASDLQGVAVE